MQSSPPDPVLACLSNHTEGQQLRRDGKLMESRDMFRRCSATACPSQIIRDCLGWMEDVAKQIPSVGFAVSADGVNRTDASVYVDDVKVLDKLSGRALELNPGLHRVRVVLPPFEPFEEQVMFTEGDKFRLVEVRFTTPRAASDPMTPADAAPEVESYRPIPITTYVFGGIGIAAAISGAAWGISNMTLKSDMERPEPEGCAPVCRPQAIDELKRRALFADISWGVSVVSLATAATFYFLRPEEPLEQPIAFDVHLLPAGAMGTISVTEF